MSTDYATPFIISVS